MVERGGTLNPQERQLAKRYAVFFRMPRLSGASPPDSNRRDRNSSIISDNVPYPGSGEVPQPPPQVQETYPGAANMTPGMDGANYEASMFDPQNFPQLPQEFYDGSNEMDLGFSDFFGGYRDLEYIPS
jgi:hypothetical protein